jgi:GH15 family glucan-1,4-alpha-glucosidase
LSDLELGVVGNCAYSALIDSRGDVVWCCLPRFDSDPVFNTLLQSEDKQDSGFLRVDLADFSHAEQRYERNSAILITTLHDAHGNSVEITDFAPRAKQYGRVFRPMTLVRRLRPLSGMPRVTVRVRPTYDYGSKHPEVTSGSNHIRYVMPDTVLRLTTDASLTAIQDETEFVLDRELALILGADESLRQPVEEVAREFESATRGYWAEWVRYLALPFEWQDAVIRAAITLKLSSYEDTGAIVAAMTTSIPEDEQGTRNWDYRYCWLRDSYYVVNTLNRLGTTATMENYIRFVVNVASQSADNRLRPVYRISGNGHMDERSVEGLAGYRGLGPVKVGNDAGRQTQHDVYGAVILAAIQSFFDSRLESPGNRSLFERLESLGEHAIAVFDKPDSGIWELRSTTHVHTYSAVMCWAAADRLRRIAAGLKLDDRVAYWAAAADELQEVICERSWNSERNSFVATFGGDHLDASLLLLAELGFVAPDDPRFRATVEAVEAELKRGDYVFRYVNSDDFGEPRNAFTLCTFWYIEALAALGRKQEARELFEHMLTRRTQLGLLSEHLDPDSGEPWGNFPQTYSMVGIVQCAMRLSRSWEESL